MDKTSDKEQTFTPRRELLILMQKESNGATRIRVEDQRDGSLLVERTAFGFEEALFARLQEAKEVSSAREDSSLSSVLSAFAGGRCYACGWPLSAPDGGCAPFNCAMRYREDTQHMAEKEKWHERANEMAEVLSRYAKVSPPHG